MQHSTIQIRRVPIEALQPAPYNPRRDLQPGDAEYEQIRQSITGHGCRDPVIWNERTGHIVGGHQRVKVLRDLGYTQIDVSVVDLSLEQEKAFNLALNKVGGAWDESKLATLLDDLLQTPSIDLRSTGFELGEARDIVGEILSDAEDSTKADPNAFDPEAELSRGGAIATQPGEIIELGRDPEFRHRLLCGDSTDADAVGRLMAVAGAATCVTDPPYLVNYTSKGGSLASWDDPEAAANAELYERFLRVAIGVAVRDNAAFYCWYASRNHSLLESAWRSVGLLPHAQIIWAKNRPVPTRSWFLWEHEPCLMGWPKGHQPPRVEKRRRSTVWRVDTLPTGRDRPNHPTPKPIELFEIPMLQHTHRGEVVYEPFAGSGTQIIAAERIGRRCFAVEKDPRYCDLIVRRFIAFAGEGAVSPEIAERYRMPTLRAGA